MVCKCRPGDGRFRLGLLTDGEGVGVTHDENLKSREKWERTEISENSLSLSNQSRHVTRTAAGNATSDMSLEQLLAMPRLPLILSASSLIDAVIRVGH